jgi:hypothetical protein
LQKQLGESPPKVEESQLWRGPAKEMAGASAAVEERWRLMTHKYRGLQQSSREVKPKFIDSTQGEPKNICKP